MEEGMIDAQQGARTRENLPAASKQASRPKLWGWMTEVASAVALHRSTLADFCLLLQPKPTTSHFVSSAKAARAASQANRGRGSIDK
jgi:hypothetical protein